MQSIESLSPVLGRVCIARLYRMRNHGDKLATRHVLRRWISEMRLLSLV